MTDPENASKTCFSCGGSMIKVEETDGAARYTCLKCGEEWVLDVNQTNRWATKKAVLMWLMVAIVGIMIAMGLSSGHSGDEIICFAPVAMIAAGFCTLLIAQYVRKDRVVVLGASFLALFLLFFTILLSLGLAGV